jgi:Co/Zn/Cd efflux system component
MMTATFFILTTAFQKLKRAQYVHYALLMVLYSVFGV